MQLPRPQRAFALLLLPLLVLALPVRAHGDAPHATGPAEAIETPFGRTGDPARVMRSIEVMMGDDMRFAPARLQVRRGDTVRLRATNRGRVMHELVLGTAEELERHAALMRRNPDMEHDAPYMAHVAPTKRGEIVWQFTQPGEFHFACLVPGHFEAGMRGTIIVK
jgi:uncharacterized cupredoxin-like copper-binding protein